MSEIPNATHEGDISLPIFDYLTQESSVIKASCVNLDNGLRLLSESAFLEMIARSPKYTTYNQKNKSVKLPSFLSAQNLQPFVDKYLTVPSNKFEYIRKDNILATGYLAELLPNVCRIYKIANKNGVLRENQIHVAERCELILDSLSNVAIAALVDEATGYQYDRPKDTLQALLELYLTPQPNKWNRQFQESFYKQVCRLRQWNYIPNSRTGAFAYTTIDLVYKRIQPGLWEELKKSNPDKKKYRYHQMLSEHIGNPHLKEHLRAITNLMKGCTNWNQFMAVVNRTYPLNDIQMDIFFDLLIESPEDFEKYKDLVS